MKRNKFLAFLKYAAETGSHALATLVDRSTLSVFLHHPPG